MDDADIDNKYDKVFTFSPAKDSILKAYTKIKMPSTYDFQPYFVARHHLAGMKD